MLYLNLDRLGGRYKIEKIAGRLTTGYAPAAHWLELMEVIMRFYILSDLHLRESVEAYKTSDRIKRLCAKIRASADIGENILFIVLGDIVDKGEELSFATACSSLSLIHDELEDYSVQFEFVPGNHDLVSGSLSLFDQLTAKYGSSCFYEKSSVYSKAYDGVNFIFADSTLSRDYAAPGRLDVDAIRAHVRSGRTNVLFCHHALSHGHGSTHDTIEDSTRIRAQLNSIGITFMFHGHVHDAKATIPSEGMIEIGCGSLSGGVTWLKSVFHQFLVGYLQEGKIALVERWVDTGDGHEDFAVNELYPKPRKFADPDSIGRIQYDSVIDYIPRVVAAYEDANQSSWTLGLNAEKRITLRQAIQKHKKLLLLCDAGMGKSVELKNLAHELSNRFHTYFYSLDNYTGQNIGDLLPDAYKTLPHNRIALILDGYDELTSDLAKKFRSKIELYVKEASGVNIVISSRSNFCGKENSNTSQMFPGFFVYILEKLDSEAMQAHVKSKGIDVNQFWSCAYAKGVDALLLNPFYLISLSRIYAKEKDLPSKKQLMDKLVSETFDMDDLKFSGDLEEQYFELFSALERLAVAMQLMHQQFFENREQYQALVSAPERELVKRCALLKRTGNEWRFLHNNFREYLAARCLARLPKDFVISIIYDGANIRPFWVNTLSYLSGFDLEWNLIDWLLENAPSALVKCESDRVGTELRIEVFERLFGKYEALHIHFDDDLCNEVEVAHFVNSSRTLSFLLDRIKNPKHHTSQYTAVNILRNYPSLFDKESSVREILLDCCENYPTTHKTVCRLAMLALCQHKLQTPETTRRLMEKFGEIDEDYIRLGLYEYLLNTGEHNNYVEYCLSGVKLIARRPDNNKKIRISNESFELENCLKNMSSVESVKRVLEWFSQEKHPNFHGSDKVLNSVIATASNLYKEGYKKLFDSILVFYLRAAKTWNTEVSQAMVKFFVNTGTLCSAAIAAATHFEESPHYMFTLVHADSTVIENLKTAYLSGDLKPHTAFHEFVRYYVKDKQQYAEYASLIKAIDGVELPEYKEPIDYEGLKRKAAQEYFDSLFDEGKRETLVNQLLEVIGDSEVTTEQLLKVGMKEDYHTALRHLRVALYHYGSNVKVSEFFAKVNINEFVIRSAQQFLSAESGVTPNQVQRDGLREIVEDELKRISFSNSVVYFPSGFSLIPLIPELLFMIQYLDYPLDEETLLDMTELPTYIFDKKDDHAKYSYLSLRLPLDKLKRRLVQNVANGQVKDWVLRDHIEFFESHHDPALAEYALNSCRDQGDTFLRSTALRYLYNTLGAEYIADEVFPLADGNFLVEIDGCCKDVPREKLRLAMEREYGKTPTMRLQAHLITYGSKLAIDDYVSKVAADKRPPEREGGYDGPTEAISTIKDPVFLTQLEALLKTVFDPGFEDDSWRGLGLSLRKAFVNCGVLAYEETIAVLTKCRPSAEENEGNYRYCNYIIEEIEQTRKMLLDTPTTLSEAKRILREIKGSY